MKRAKGDNDGNAKAHDKDEGETRAPTAASRLNDDEDDNGGEHDDKGDDDNDNDGDHDYKCRKVMMNSERQRRRLSRGERPSATRQR